MVGCGACRPPVRRTPFEGSPAGSLRWSHCAVCECWLYDSRGLQPGGGIEGGRGQRLIHKDSLFPCPPTPTALRSKRSSVLTQEHQITLKSVISAGARGQGQGAFSTGRTSMYLLSLLLGFVCFRCVLTGARGKNRHAVDRAAHCHGTSRRADGATGGRTRCSCCSTGKIRFSLGGIHVRFSSAVFASAPLQGCSTCMCVLLSPYDALQFSTNKASQPTLSS